MKKVVAFLLKLMCKPCPICGRKPSVVVKTDWVSGNDSITISHCDISVLVDGDLSGNDVVKSAEVWNQCISQYSEAEDFEP